MKKRSTAIKFKITKVKYCRIKNLGNYENERIELEAETTTDKVAETTKFLKEKTFRMLNINEVNSDHGYGCICDSCMEEFIGC